MSVSHSHSLAPLDLSLDLAISYFDMLQELCILLLLLALIENASACLHYLEHALPLIQNALLLLLQLLLSLLFLLFLVIRMQPNQPKPNQSTQSNPAQPPSVL
jgi:hypothetical protein